MSAAFDQDKADAFAATMMGVLNGGALALMCSIGRRTGLFDTMASMLAATSADIADAAGLNERYVREWLAAMACGGIVEHDPGRNTFRLPAEHAGLLTKAAGPTAISHYCQFIGQFGEVETEIVEAFRSGGGVPYDRYARFVELMAETSGLRFTLGLVDQVIPLLPGAVEKLRDGGELADVGCGRGRAVLLLAAAFPRSQFVGFDFSEEAIRAAAAEAGAAGLANARFERRDAADLGLEARFDYVTSFDAIHDQAHCGRMLQGVFAAVRPGGAYLCVEPRASSVLADNLAHPMGPFIYSVSTMHCMPVSLAYGGEGLGSAWGEQLARERLHTAGFRDTTVTTRPFDRMNTYFVSHKPA
ncbi:MAG: class I SAM-dependent methyltransferase [Acidimicrobiales bacterium]